jgi:thymidylate synthase ThyX
MAYAARVLLDSISDAGIRLTTMEATFPRFVLAEANTHRQFSRNSASSRAIPTNKIIERVENDAVLPVEWGRNQKGMSASELLTQEDEEEAKGAWLAARDAVVEQARRLQHLHVHKQVVNRLLEPFLWHTVIVTATEWDNFFELRCSPNAQPEIREAALRMRAAREASVPGIVHMGGWHLPLVQPDERSLDVETLKRISAARCARVSYLTHAGTREIEKDLELYERLKKDRHLSPFEHVATPSGDGAFHANFRGWIQMRQEVASTQQID